MANLGGSIMGFEGNINTMIFRGVIKEFDGRFFEGHCERAMYRIINFDDLFFFAEEISTGCIFPIYRRLVQNGNVKGVNCYSSYLKYGKYYAFCVLKMKEGELFKYSFDESCVQLGDFEIPSVDEVNRYLDLKKGDMRWKYQLRQMEASNEYMCDLNLIKEKISMLKDDIQEFSVKFDSVTPKYVSYIPSINLKPIEDMGYDLSTQSELCNLIGRKEELKRIVKAIAIEGTSVMLLGEPGTGKTSIVEKLALDIRNGNCKFLDGKIIFSLSTANLVSGTKFRGEFEDKLKEFVKFCNENRGRIIVFIDEIHTLCGLGRSDGSNIDAANILKPYISSGDIIVIGATTKMEYEKYMTGDPAFLRRFENIEISTLTKEMNIEIMLSYIDELEKKYKIKLDLNETEKLLMVEHIFKITDGKCAFVAGNVKIENPTLEKRILKSAFAEAIYNGKNSVSMEEINYAILEYDKLSLEFMSEFGFDLSIQENLCNLIGREKELERIVKAIAIEGNSVLLVGEPGTGKTSIVEKLALDIRNKNCEFLEGKRIFSLNSLSLSSGSKYRGDFEEKMNKLINVCRKNKGKIILFIDEIHTLYGLGRTADSSIDAMNMLKPYISNGDITIIGATTKIEYEKYMANDPAFLRRFEEVEISSMTEEEKTKILISYVKDLESMYNLKMNYNEIIVHNLMNYIVKITELGYQDVKGVKVENPTISKRLVQDAFSDAKFHKKDVVTIEDIFFAILDCDRLPLDFRKECADNLKQYFNNCNKDISVYVPRLTKGGKVGFAY